MCWLPVLQGGRGKGMAALGSFPLIVEENTLKACCDTGGHKPFSKWVLLTPQGSLSTVST